MYFSHAFVTKWKSGQWFDRTGANVIVTYDNTHTAYDIDPDDRDAFTTWVHEVFGNDNSDPEDIIIHWI